MKTRLQVLASSYTAKQLRWLFQCPTVISKDISELWDVPSSINIEKEYYKKELLNNLSTVAKEILEIAETLNGGKIKTKLKRVLSEKGFKRNTVNIAMKELLGYYTCLRTC